jgi:hypothetical protein
MRRVVRFALVGSSASRLEAPMHRSVPYLLCGLLALVVADAGNNDDEASTHLRRKCHAPFTVSEKV